MALIDTDDPDRLNEAQLALLREWIQEPMSEEWNDDRLNTMWLLMGKDLRATAYEFWRGKATAASSLVDISENGSSRKVGDLYKNYFAIMQSFAPEVPDGGVRRPKTNAITRP